ncbi:MAG: NADH-quinone oxidoreductase subunit L [Phycisphaerae bacterium]|nr:NADH-quinone oxidoreductase subunit L [Phycisphaerae bacterium]
MSDVTTGILTALGGVGTLAASGGDAAAHAPASGGALPAASPLVLLIPLLPLLGCVLCGLCAAAGVRTKLPAWLTVACLGAAFVAALKMLGDATGGPGTHATIAHAFDWFRIEWGKGPGGVSRELVANFSFYVDTLTCLWMLFVTGLATLIGLYASEYMAGERGPGYCRFFAAFNLFVLSMSCLVMGDNLLLLYLGWEGVGLCSYLLIGYFYQKPSAVAAAKKAFIMNRIGDLGLALGIMLTFVKFGTVEYAELFERIRPFVELARHGRFDEIPFSVQLIPLLFTVGAFGKSAQLPLYVWLPDAMEGPTPVSALIHAATMVTAGVYLVARFIPFYVCSDLALPVVAWVGTLTALTAATIGMAQFDIKRIMAYSTVSQLGYMFAGLGVLTSTGAAFHVFTHAFFKALLFLSCGAVMHGFGGQLDLRKLSGVRKMPGWGIVGVCMLVGCLNLSGFPLLTSGFFSKDMILAQAFTTPGFAAIGWILLLTAGLTAYYTFRVYFRVFEGPSQFEPGDEAHAHADPGDQAHAHAPAGHAHGGHEHGHGQGHGDGHFHPHAPGWAINTVLAVLAVCSTAAIGAYFIDRDHHGWVGRMVDSSTAAWEAPGAGHSGAHAEPPAETGHGAAPGTFLGMDPHAVMYYVSAVVALVGIGAAWWLHLAGRTAAATSRADGLLAAAGPVARGAQGKWFVDEVYDALVVTPLWVLAHVFHLLDKLLIDGLVNLAGWVPRGAGRTASTGQNGLLHSYALGMAGGLAIVLVVALFMVKN